MSLEPIGFVTIIVGLFCLALGQRAAGAILVVTTLFGSAAALLIGAANIQPAHLLLGFLAAATLTRRREAAAIIEAIRPPQAGFWLTCLVVFAVAGGAFLPRIFAGTTQIIPLGTSEYADTGAGVPLGPVSSNFTQAVYFIADLACFCMIYAIASSRAGFEVIAKAVLFYAAGNALFAVIDMATYSTGTQGLLDVIRNARYTLHNEEEIAGLKRIVGSFPEASAFAHSTLGAFAFVGTMWLCGRFALWSGLLALLSLALLVLSTSSTGLVGAFPALAILYATAFTRCGSSRRSRNSSAAVLLGPLLAAAAVLVILLNDALYAAVRHYVDLLVVSKSGSSSGLERASWNAFAMRNFWDSRGLGVGLGTVRTSSFPVALLSNVGVPGVVLYWLFIGSALWRRRGAAPSFPADVALAARNACLSLIIADCFAAPSVEQGLLFYTLAALACVEPAPLAAAAGLARRLRTLPSAVGRGGVAASHSGAFQSLRLSGGPAGQPSGGPASRPNTWT
jgi:hypothetical protein